MRVAFEAYGCTLSYGESRRARRLAEEAGMEATEDASSAPVVVVHSCTVIGRTDRHMVRRARELVASGRRVVLAGCLPRAQRETAEQLGREGVIVVTGGEPEDVLIALRGMDPGRLPEPGALPETPAHPGSFPDPSKRADGIVPIASGCLGACSYCITRFAWGRLQSRSIEDVVDVARGLLTEGFREVQLTAQDTGVWGRDLGGHSNLPDLVRAIARIDGAPADYRVRVGMLNPDSLAPIMADLVDALTGPRVYRFAHVPVQSGSDRVLGLMNRRYTADEFASLVVGLRASVPGVTVHTDVICGFPTETEEDFGRTLDLLRRARPDVTNVKAFSPRPGTEAARMEGAPHGRLVKDRTRRAALLCGELTRASLERRVGARGEVLVTETGKRGTLMARDIGYRPVVLEGGEGAPRVGSVVPVRIVGARGVYLRAEVC